MTTLRTLALASAALIAGTTFTSCAGWEKKACWKESQSSKPVTKEKRVVTQTPGWKTLPSLPSTMVTPILGKALIDHSGLPTRKGRCESSA